MEQNVEGKNVWIQNVPSTIRVVSFFCSDLYSSPNIVRVIKLGRMRWAGHVAHMGEERGVYRVLLGETGGKETTGET